MTDAPKRIWRENADFNGEGDNYVRADHADALALRAVEEMRREVFAAVVKYLRKEADAHAGKWAGMDPRDALRQLADTLERKERPRVDPAQIIADARQEQEAGE